MRRSLAVFPALHTNPTQNQPITTMTLQDLKSALARHPDRQFQVLLPDGDAVPESFHITEVGRVQHRFIDCGGRLHETENCRIQAWVGGDSDHRVGTRKMASILEKAESLLPNPAVPLEIEYGPVSATQYPVLDLQVSSDAVILRLGTRPTDCLAKENCGASADAAPQEIACCGSSCGCR